MNLATLKAWATQPTTITAFGTVALGAVTAAAHFAGASTELAGGLGLLSYALVHAGINDSTASRSVEKLIEDAVRAYMEHRLATSLPLIVTDATTAISAMMTSATTTTPIPVVAVGDLAPIPPAV